MEEVGPLGAHGADDVAGEPRAHVGAAADGRDGTPSRRAPVEAGRVGAGHVEAEETRVDAALAQRRQQRQQVPLRAADARAACGCAGPSPPAPRVDRLDLVRHPSRRTALARLRRLGPEPRARSGSRAESRAVTPARRYRQPTRDSRSRRADDRPGAARAGRDDRPRRCERLDRDYGRALVRGCEQQRVERRVPGTMSLRKPRKRQRSATPSSTASASTRRAVAPSPTSTSSASTTVPERAQACGPGRAAA